MELRDVVVTPVIILLVLFLAFFSRHWFTDQQTRSFFIPALVLKIFGAISVGIIYQFYYQGGDTYMYHEGSRVIWQAIWESPTQGILLFFRRAFEYDGVYKYASQIYFFRDPPSLVIVKISAFFDLFTFSAYSATAVLFAVFSFAGMWSLFMVFYRQYPHLQKELAWCTLFIPSVFFWGSGVLKDSIVIGCIGFSTYQFYVLFFEKRISVVNLLVLFASLYLIFCIKKFVLQAYLPAVIIWVMIKNLKTMRSVIVKLMFVPLLAMMMVYSIYFSIVKVGEGDERYSIDKIAETAKITAYDIRYWTGREAGSGYSLGELDGSWQSMVKLAPQAINVSLFRPYLWEVNNPLMLLSALEGSFFLLFLIRILFRRRLKIFKAFSDPNVAFALAFSLAFAFAVGASTFNFGTLSRYKIPLLPFFAVALVLLDHSNKERKVGVLEATE